MSGRKKFIVNREAIRNSYICNQKYMRDLQTIAAPLTQLNAAGFCYSKFKNGIRVVELTTISKYTDHYLAKLNTYPISDFIENHYHKIKTGLSVYPHNIGDLSKNYIYQDMKDHGMTNAIFFTVLSNDQSTIERFSFTFDKIDILISKLNDLSTFFQFNYYFKEKANKIIAQSIAKNKIFIPDKKLLLPGTTLNKDLSDNKSLDIKKYYFEFLPDGKYLTQREFEILKLYCLGDTAKTISIKLNASYRTIETHLQKIRKKIGNNNLLKIVTSSLAAITLL
jgi:DNA-binding CsgD family transcriptional regulator